MSGGGGVITRGRVLHDPYDDDDIMVMVAVEPGLPYGGSMIRAQPLPGDAPTRTGSTVYVEIEVPPEPGRTPSWARIVDRPEPTAVTVDRDVVARRELAGRVKEAIRHHGRLRVSPMLIEGMASAAADVIVKSDLRAAAAAPADVEHEEDSMLRRQLDDATAEVARLAREVQELRDLGSIWPLRQRLEEQRRQIDELREDLERRDEQVGRAVALARAIWSPDRGLRQGMPDWLFKSSAQWPDVVRWVSDPPSVDEPRPDPSQDERRTPIAAGWGRERSTVWPCPRCEQRHAITGDTWLDCACGARYQFVYHDDPEDKPASEVTAGEVDGWRWWRVEDALDDDWLVYDNRPTVDAYWADTARAHRDPTPTLVQGRVPWAVVREATGS